MPEAFIDVSELKTDTLRDIVVTSGVIWPDGDDRESRLFRFQARRIVAEAFRQGMESGQKLNAVVATMSQRANQPDWPAADKAYQHHYSGCRPVARQAANASHPQGTQNPPPQGVPVRFRPRAP